MTAELTDNIVKLKMDLPSFKNKNQRKWFQLAFLTLLFLTIIIWLIVVSVNVKSLQEFVDKEKALHEKPDLDEIYTNLGDYGYFVKLNQVMTFIYAEGSCQDIDGSLVEFYENDPNIQDFLMTLKQEFTPSFWIGLRDPNGWGNAKFQWLKTGNYFSESLPAMNLWSKGEPDHAALERWVATDPNSKDNVTIMNVGHNYKSHVICQRNSVE